MKIKFIYFIFILVLLSCYLPYSTKSQRESVSALVVSMNSRLAKIDKDFERKEQALQRAFNGGTYIKRFLNFRTQADEKKRELLSSLFERIHSINLQDQNELEVKKDFLNRFLQERQKTLVRDISNVKALNLLSGSALTNFVTESNSLNEKAKRELQQLLSARYKYFLFCLILQVVILVIKYSDFLYN